jgi:phosphatidate cytidylyltransferase
MAFSERLSRLGEGLIKRVWSALAILPLVLLAVWAGGPALLVFLAIAGVIMSYEWVRLLASTRPRGDAIVLSGGLFALLLVAHLASPNDALRLLLVFLFVLGGMFWFFCWRVTPVVGGLVYLGWPLLAVAFFRDSASGSFVLLYIFLTVWSVDIFAMFSGKLIGGPQMAPRISPNKTWAGLMGAVFGAALVGLVAYYTANALVALTLALPVILLLGGVLAVVSQMGDLFESALKRKYDLKDTGSILPGHGGVLDRVDGLIGALIFLHLIVLLRGQSPLHSILVW